MCIRLQWDDNDHTILHQIFEENWTLQAYFHSIEAVEAMTTDSSQPVTLIMDMSAAETPMIHYVRGRTVDEARATQNINRVIIVNPGKFLPRVGCPINTVKTLTEAYSLLDTKLVAKLA